MQLPKLNFPIKLDFKITKCNSNEYEIYDPIRRKYVKLNPEEWVRQHFIHYFLKNQISRNQILVEKQITLNQSPKRLDMLVMSKSEIQFLIEFKAPTIPLQMSHFEQIARYNSVVEAPYIIVSNGLHHIGMSHNIQTGYQPITQEDLLGWILSEQRL